MNPSKHLTSEKGYKVIQGYEGVCNIKRVRKKIGKLTLSQTFFVKYIYFPC